MFQAHNVDREYITIHVLSSDVFVRIRWIPRHVRAMRTLVSGFLSAAGRNEMTPKMIPREVTVRAIDTLIRLRASRIVDVPELSIR